AHPRHRMRPQGGCHAKADAGARRAAGGPVRWAPTDSESSSTGPKPESARGGTVTRKIALSLDALQVESFETAADRPARGTVRGHVGVDALGDGSNDISCDTCQT